MHASPPSPAPRKSNRKPVLIGVAIVLGMAAVGGIMDAVGGSDEPDEAAAAPSPTASTRQAAVTPQSKLADSIGKELGRGNRDPDRVTEVTLAGEMLTVKWAINSQLTEGLTRKGARRDVVDILKAIKGAGVPVGRAHLHGTYAMRDSAGQTSEDTVLRVLYTGATIEEFDPGAVVRDKVVDLAEPGAFIAPAFR